MSQSREPGAPRILVIAAYFGRLPTYFDLWVNSCSFNEGIDWLVVTDDPGLPAERPSNVRFQLMSFARFHDQVRQRVGVAPERLIPYKIVDLKPAYGHIFSEEVAPYDFWGCCDLDMIFGDVLGFIPVEAFASYSKIFNRGHLTLYRNTDEAKSFYRLKAPGIDWEAIFRDPEPRMYDEWKGIHAVLNHHGIPQYHSEVIADIDPRRFRFTTTKQRNYRFQVYGWEAGHVYRIHHDGNLIGRAEFAYIHFQKRRLARGTFAAGAPFYVTPYGFLEKRQADHELQITRELNDPSVIEEARYVAGRMTRRIGRLLSR